MVRHSTVPIRRDHFTEQMSVFLVTLAGSILLQSACVATKGKSKGTFLYFSLCVKQNVSCHAKLNHEL